MSHEFENGFLGGTVQGQRWAAWHGLGTEITENVVTAAGAMQLVPELRSEVAPKRLGWQDDDGSWSYIDEEVANVRVDDKQWLANVGVGYARVQPWKAFEFVDDLVGSGDAKYHTAGTLNHGRRIWLLARLNDLDVKVEGMDMEHIALYLLLTNSYDRSASLRTCITPVRVVCANTEAMAFRTAQREWSMRHTESITGKLAEAKQTLGLVHTWVAAFEDAAAQMLDRKLTGKQYDRFLEDLVPKTVRVENEPEGKAARNRTDVMVSIRRTYEDAPSLAHCRGTAWAAYNAVTEYQDWFTRVKDSKRTTADERRFMRQTGANPMKDRAFELLMPELALAA